MSDREGLEKLAPCPFCGNEPVSMDGVTRLWACVKHTFWMSREEWNRRAPLAPRGRGCGKQKECETCEGSGVMSVLHHVEAPDCHEVYVDEECAECHGTGIGWIGEWIERALKAESVLAARPMEGKAEAGVCTQCGEPAVFCNKHAYEMYFPAPAAAAPEGPGLRDQAISLIRDYRHPPKFETPEDVNDFGKQLLDEMDALLADVAALQGEEGK